VAECSLSTRMPPLGCAQKTTSHSSRSSPIQEAVSVLCWKSLLGLDSSGDIDGQIDGSIVDLFKLKTITKRKVLIPALVLLLAMIKSGKVGGEYLIPGPG
jgi:hypothetical protein